MSNIFLFGRIKNPKVRLLFVIGFIFAVADAVLAYIESSFIAQFINQKLIGVFFALAYLTAFILINNYSRFINRFGNFKTAMAALLVSAGALLTLVLTDRPWLSLAALLVYLCARPLIFISLDIFLEFFSADSSTGRMRGLYLTIVNLGWLVSPLIMGQLMGEKSAYRYPFTLSLILTVTIIVLLFLTVGKVAHRQPTGKKSFAWGKTFLRLWRNKDLRSIFLIECLLNFFYSWMVIYTPLYLLGLGLSWQTIGIIFTIMLLPFVLFEFPAGYLADKFLGEKELIIAGLLIMSIASFFIFWANDVNFIFWGVVLFLSRIGAALVEAMRDTYFFKKIDYQDVGLINIFRSAWPLAFFLGPLASVIILQFTEMNSLYLILGIILLFGLYFPFMLKDTK